jgi:hypothetical protein
MYYRRGTKVHSYIRTKIEGDNVNFSRRYVICDFPLDEFFFWCPMNLSLEITYKFHGDVPKDL